MLEAITIGGLILAVGFSVIAIVVSVNTRKEIEDELDSK